ncbi:MAG: hypothetical protein ABSF75_02810 [Terracidiphilus sp.]|jgi:hypothetical protein
MPKLRFVIACEKVIIDQAGPVSLISIFQKMNIQLQAAPLPEKALSNIRWHAFSLWENDPKDAGQSFTVVVEVFNPDGTVFNRSEVPYTNNVPGNSQTKVNLMFAVVPIWMEGDIVIRTWLKENEKESGEYRFAIVYLPKVENAEANNSVSA